MLPLAVIAAHDCSEEQNQAIPLQRGMRNFTILTSGAPRYSNGDPGELVCRLEKAHFAVPPCSEEFAVRRCTNCKHQLQGTRRDIAPQ
jgi:hypothetical protein